MDIFVEVTISGSLMDRGSIRAGNDRTFDSRADHFERWLQRNQYSVELFARLPQSEAIAVVGTYVRQVNLGDSIKSTKNMSEKTLIGYMKSAAATYLKASRKTLSLYVPSPTGGNDVLHPYLSDVIHQRTAWKKPREKREPFTMEMLEALATDLHIKLRADASIFLSKEHAILDWMGLGIHTGSRLSEYGQSKPTKKNPIALVPSSEDAGEWAGTPLAFIRSDFTYYDKALVQHSYIECLRDPHLAEYVRIRFRFDKSKNNFSVRKFKRLSGIIACPVKRSLSALRRADMLGIPQDYPIGAFRPPDAAPHMYAFIKGEHVQDVMRRACRLAYPDPNHYLRIHIHLLMSHSNRITAAVAMYNAGVSIPVIAFRLRWSPESVSFYLRDCFRAIGSLTQAAIEGAYIN